MLNPEAWLITAVVAGISTVSPRKIPSRRTALVRPRRIEHGVTKETSWACPHRGQLEVEKIKEIATEKHCTPAQLALAWLLTQGRDVVPIPGTKRRDRLEENLRAIEISLSDNELRRIEEATPLGAAAEARYPEAIMHTINR